MLLLCKSNVPTTVGAYPKATGRLTQVPWRRTLQPWRDSPTEPRMNEPRMGLLSEWTEPRMGLNTEWDLTPNGTQPRMDST